MTTRKTLGMTASVMLMLCFFCGVTVRDHSSQWVNWWEGSNLTHWVLPQIMGYERWFK